MALVVNKRLYCRPRHLAGGRQTTHLEEHELVERVVPLHEEDALRVGAAQVLVAVVRVPAHAALQVKQRTNYSFDYNDEY